jgi:O-antigen/teichoic acid export membrane protein
VLADAGNKAFSPWLYGALSRNNPDSKARIVRYTYLLFLVVPLAAVLFGMAAPYILTLIVGEQFRGGSDVVLYIAVGGAFSGMYYLVANYIFFAAKNEMLALATLVSGFAGVPLSWNLVGLYGAVGAAQAYMAAQGLCFLLTWLLAARSHPMPWSIIWRDALGFASRFRN